MLYRLHRALSTPTGRAALGFVLGYAALHLLAGAFRDLTAQLDEERQAGHVDGYRQARRELLAELDHDDDDQDDADDQDDDVVIDEAVPPARRGD